MSWRDEAACLDKPVEWFFPPKSSTYEQGQAVCAGCPVRAECRADHARAERELGVALPGLWGGVVYTLRARRMRDRQLVARSCVVCGSEFHDKGTGKLPKYCGFNCSNRASTRRHRGAPVGDVEFEVWKSYRGVGA